MAQSEKMKQTLDKLEAGVMEFFTSDKYISYLQVMSKFHTYSANNQILIAMQMPEATIVAGYNSWMRNFDRHVKRGEKSITILAPMKVKIKIDTDRRDADGKVIQEERETIKFRPVSVFDVSQTEGKPLPEIISELTVMSSCLMLQGRLHHIRSRSGRWRGAQKAGAITHKKKLSLKKE